MTTDEFDLGGQKYKTARLTAMQQFHVARRLAPVITSLSEVDFSALRDPQEGGEGSGRALRLMKPIADALHNLSDQDSEYVINVCMGVVYRGQPAATGTVWAAAWSKAAGKPMFEDIDLTVMLQLTVRVLMENLSGFLPARAPA